MKVSARSSTPESHAVALLTYLPGATGTGANGESGVLSVLGLSAVFSSFRALISPACFILFSATGPRSTA